MHRLLIIPFLLLAACATVGPQPDRIPYPAVVDWIERLPYVPGELDCSGKAALAADFYRRHGVPALVAIIPAPQLLRFEHSLLLPHHAVVLALVDGGWILVDPTDRRNVDGQPAPVSYRILSPSVLAQELAWAVEYLKTIGLKPPE